MVNGRKCFKFLDVEGYLLIIVLYAQIYWYLRRDTSLIDEICIFALFVNDVTVVTFGTEERIGMFVSFCTNNITLTTY
jgi:hypothetical protein